MIVKLIGTESALDPATGSDIGSATVVRVMNSSGTAQKVTVKDGDNTVGEVTLAAGEALHLQKTATHTLLANSSVKAVKVAHAN